MLFFTSYTEAKMLALQLVLAAPPFLSEALDVFTDLLWLKAGQLTVLASIVGLLELELFAAQV